MINPKFFILSLIFTYSISNTILRSPMIIGDNYVFNINEHPKCDIHYCSLTLHSNDFYQYLNCRGEYLIGNQKYGLTEDESISICMYTFHAKDISYTISQGNAGLYGCCMDRVNAGIYKIWNYNRLYDIPSIEYLYTGINLDRSKNNGLLDGEKCLFKEGDTIIFPSLGSTSADYNVARQFGIQNSEGGIIFKIKTLRSKTKAVPIQEFSQHPNEKEYLFPPASKFKVISRCIRNYNLEKVIYNIDLEELEEMDDIKEYETQQIDNNDNILREYTKACTQCNDDTHIFCKYCKNPNKCSECYAGYTPNENGICTKCSDNCLKCESNNLNKCTECFNGFGLVNNKCQECKVSNCKKCDNDIKVCKICKKGYVLINGSCAKKTSEFDSWCKNYEYTIPIFKWWKKCTQCIGPTYLEKNKCIECKDKKCAQCLKDENGNEICSKCINGYGLEKGVCSLKCTEGCEKCEKDQCLNCKKHFYLYNNKICKECDKNCLECENESGKCTKCTQYSALKENKCEKCSSNCLKCHFDENKNEVCDKCIEGRYLKNGICENCNIEGCAECLDNSKCLFCNNYYYTLNENKKCIKCDKGCEKCRIESGEKKCDICINYYYYMNSEGKCQNCEENGCSECKYKNNTKECTKCDSYYTLSDGKCYKCNVPNCRFCEIVSGKEVCLYCANNENFYEFGLSSYGIKEGKCLECEKEGCEICENNADTGSLECKNKAGHSSFLSSNLKIILISFLLIIFNDY